MFCPSCGKQIPEQSVFCMFCGNRVCTPTTPPRISDTRPPVNIGKILFGFIGTVTRSKEAGIFSLPEVSRDGFWVGFSLVDEKGNPTAYDGTATLKIEITQGDSIAYKSHRVLKTELSIADVKASGFRHDDKIGLYYRCEQLWGIRGLQVGNTVDAYADIELFFTPQGSKQQLFQSRSKIRADVQA